MARLVEEGCSLLIWTSHPVEDGALQNFLFLAPLLWHNYVRVNKFESGPNYAPRVDSMAPIKEWLLCSTSL